MVLADELQELEFSSVTISFFIHSTEDAERVIAVVAKNTGITKEMISLENLTGHYGNQIVTAKAHITGDAATEVGARIFANLSKKAKVVLASEVERSVDEHDSLYIRIDRQSLSKEEKEEEGAREDEGISLSDDEPIRIKLKPKFRKGGHNQMVKQYEELLR